MSSTNAVIAARRDLAERLRAGLPERVVVFGYWPERVDAPCALIAAASPYLTNEDTTFGSWRIAHEVTLVADPVATNEGATDDLDDLISAALIALEGDAATVSPPEMLEASGARYMTARVTVRDVIRLT